MIILPGSVDFQITMDALPLIPITNQIMIVKPGSNGLLQPATIKEAQEYVYDGELDERLSEIGLKKDADTYG